MRMGFLVVAAAAMLVPATAFAGTFFRTPSGNIRCEAWRFHGRYGVSCVVLSEKIPKPYKQGRDYHLWTLDSGPLGVIDDYTRWSPHSSYRVLRYGTALSRPGLTCVSRMTGLRCTSRRGHGYFLSREHQRAW
jgi:Family of unknown function (DUF6636)